MINILKQKLLPMERFSSIYLVIAFWLIHLFFLSTSVSAQLSWQATNSETAYPIATFSSLDTILYIGTLGGGIYKTHDEGESWTACNNGLSDFTITSLVWQNDNLYAGTYEGSIYLSQDHGTTWSLISDKQVLKTWSLANVGNRLLAGTVSGIYYTDNNGVNWAKAILPNNNAAHHIIYSLLIQGNLIIAGSAGHIYYSEDGGNTWQQSELGSLFEVHQLLSLNGHFMAGTSGTGWYFSENGKEWLGHPEFGGQGNIQAAVLVDNELVSAVSLNGVLQENSPMNQGLTDAAFKV